MASCGPTSVKTPLKTKKEASINNLTIHKHELFHWLAGQLPCSISASSPTLKILLGDFPFDIDNKEQCQWLTGDWHMNRWKCLEQKCYGVPFSPLWVHTFVTYWSQITLQMSHSTATWTPLFEKKKNIYIYLHKCHFFSNPSASPFPYMQTYRIWLTH